MTVTLGSGVSGTATGTGTHYVGEKVTLGGITYNTTGYHGLTWSSSDVTLSSATATNPTFIMPDKDVTITVAGTPNTYTIAYSANGGSGSINSIPGTYGQNVTLSATSAMSRSGYYVAPGWAIANNSVGASYPSGNVTVSTLASGANVASTNNATITIYAKWLQNCDYGGTSAFRLADDKCWTRTSQGSAAWANAAAKCPSGFSLPSKDQFITLIVSSNYGTGANLYNTTGWSAGYWSSTEYASDTSYAWYLDVGSSYSRVIYYSYKTTSRGVVCVKS